MKKISILSACALISLGAFAQESVVKEAERAMKKNAGFTEVVGIMTPAFSDPTTKNQAQTYYIPGKAGFAQFDQLMVQESLGKIDDAGRQAKPAALMGGYEYMMKALPLDSVPDEKGKVKPKYSKDIVNTIGGHYNDFYQAGVEFWGERNYPEAYKAWGVYADLPSNPAFAKAIPVIPADTIINEVIFNQGLAAWQMNDFDLATKAFLKAKDKGYNKKNIYDYGIAVASQAKNEEALLLFAEEAQKLYGKEDPNYIGYIINNSISKGRYSEAVNLIDEAIANDPNNAQYYVIKGILFETDDIEGDSKAMYEKAVALDDHNVQALYNLGRMYYNQALNIYNDAPNESEAFNKVFNEEFKPAMLQAVDYFNRADAIDSDNYDMLKLLENAYYLLNDDTNMNIIKARVGD